MRAGRAQTHRGATRRTLDVRHAAQSLMGRHLADLALSTMRPFGYASGDEVMRDAALAAVGSRHFGAMSHHFERFDVSRFGRSM